MATVSKPDNISMTTTPSFPKQILKRILIYTGISALIGASGLVGVSFLAVFAAGIILHLGVAYVIVVIVITLRNRKKEQENLKTATPNYLSSVEKNPAFTFADISQIQTFSSNFVITVTGIIIAVLAWQETYPFYDRAGDDPTIYTFFAIFGTAFVFQTIYTIVVNRPLIYNQELRMAEQQAYRTRSGAWKLILANRIWSWGIWVSGGLLSAFILVNMYINL
jgi:hypothetical protein